jgi:hypothetical protein
MVIFSTANRVSRERQYPRQVILTFFETRHGEQDVKIKITFISLEWVATGIQ